MGFEVIDLGGGGIRRQTEAHGNGDRETRSKVVRETKGQMGIKPIDVKKYSSQRAARWEDKAQKDKNGGIDRDRDTDAVEGERQVQAGRQIKIQRGGDGFSMC